ncbi:MAG: cob(I)yrinic acid a,c-diamide adenosyltransferase [Desulfobacteraceae bacterium]|nr:cob(I)yrinic acid a,c-diamide adenosyltransferase [Desulfobacteraceae bacterium]
MEKGYVQVYTGDGKGKTTAALGLAIRAAGAGLKVYIAQFLKQGAYSELKALERFADYITLEQFGTGKFIRGNPDAADISAGKKGLAAVRAAFSSGAYDVVVMEEAGVAEKFGVVSTDDLLAVIREKPEAVELVITGRGVSGHVLAAADLITEMREIRHYYLNGVMARTGIES